MREKDWANLPERRGPRLLVLGRSGQLGTALARCATRDARIVCVGRPELDIADRSSIDRAIARHDPDVIVNAAAYTAVDRAEGDPEGAMAVNALGAGNAAAAAHTAGLPIVHISTDYVFSGRKRTPYVETDATDPINVYGRSKLAGERAVAAANPAHAILRTGWLYAPWGTNFARTMLRLARERGEVRVVADQFGTPTFVPHLADVVIAVAAALRAGRDDGNYGVFHVTAPGRASWADFAERIFAVCGPMGLGAAVVKRIATEEYPTPAARPAYSVLSSQKIGTVFGVALPDWKVGVAAFADACREGDHIANEAQVPAVLSTS